jgi:hypothetical protein
MNSDGTIFHRITYNPANDLDPALSADGTKIAFVSDRDGGYEIYTMAFNGSGLARLTFTSTAERYPAWSPDGTKILFVSNRSGNNELYVMNAADGSGVTNLTNNFANDEEPCWGGLVSLSTPIYTPTIKLTPTIIPIPTPTPVYINFDLYPNGSPIDGTASNGTSWPGTFITNQYASFGAIFSSTNGGPIATVGSGEASSIPNLLCENPDSFQPIIVNIVNPATGNPWTADSIDVTLISVGDATYTAIAYASDLSTVLDSVSVTNPGTGVGWCNKNLIKLIGPGIAKITFKITKSFPGDGCGIDDLYIWYR